jgi:CRP-like cAMP-binding protein
MENSDPMEKEVDRLVEENDTAGAVKLLLEMIERQAQSHNFAQAEALRERLMVVDDMALSEIIKAAEIIEEAKSSAQDPDHLRRFAGLYDNLTQEETNTLFFGMQALRVDAGDVLYHQGKPNNRLFFLDQGQLNLFFTRQGRDSLISILEAGAIAGQDSFLISSFATTSLAAQSRADLHVLDLATVTQWKADQPGLVDKLEQFCQRHSVGDLVAAKGMERRTSRRIKMEGQVMAHIMGDDDAPAGKPFRGDLADLSNTGLSFFIRATDRAARMLLGRKLKVRFTVKTPSQDQTVERKALTVAVNALYIGDYSVHLRFETPLKSNADS